MKYKAVIFDLDGTLYDKRRLPFLIILHNLFNLRLLKAERVCRYEIAGQYFGSSDKLFEELFKRMGAFAGTTTEKTRKWYFDKYMPLQVRLLKKYFSARKGLPEIISALRAEGIKLAVFSDYCLVSKKLEAIGLSELMFDVIVESPEVGGLKPCRESFLFVAGKLGENPEEILMVGDRIATDGIGAETVGMEFQMVDFFLSAWTS